MELVVCLVQVVIDDDEVRGSGLSIIDLALGHRQTGLQALWGLGAARFEPLPERLE